MIVKCFHDDYCEFSKTRKNSLGEDTRKPWTVEGEEEKKLSRVKGEKKKRE
jgi:hypothetical protein